MPNLTFAEQVKIILSRKGMTIKELAETIEGQTGKKMSRQNLTQRLGRDNFQEKDMRMIAEILGCGFQLDILGTAVEERMTVKPVSKPAIEIIPQEEMLEEAERDITVGELVDISQELDEIEKQADQEIQPEESVPQPELSLSEEEMTAILNDGEVTLEETAKKAGWKGYLSGIFKKSSKEEEDGTGLEEVEEEKDVIASQGEKSSETPEAKGDGKAEINPFTGVEYESNSVRVHPNRIGYVQVYDRKDHKWTDMTEWAFLGYQERKKVLLGKDYEPPIYLD